MMKFKSLFRSRKASPTGNEANSAVSPSASSLSHSSSSSSIATHSASSPIRHGAEPQEATMSGPSRMPPITITSRIRSSTDPNLLSPTLPQLPVIESNSDYLMFHDEASGDYPVDTINHQVNFVHLKNIIFCIMFNTMCLIFR